MSSDTDKLLTRSKQDQQEENYILITGCTHGLGKLIAYKLAKRNFTITMACRNKQEAENYAVELKEKTGNNKIHVIQLDLNSLSSIKQCAEEYKALNLPLNILLNNAGIMDFTSKFDLTDYGVEKHFGV
ncbi:MAG: hypothetical protein EZS28_044987 [Streblomastix strix]|uniref:Uncharacterized protein n=1 Tax=Streblomastix strix TaxID=222440 RepID=A0A5J4TLU4_9EUKA|nr:MAG: hypothetical protein EZS28_044987 [Streblomastix strix]